MLNSLGRHAVFVSVFSVSMILLFALTIEVLAMVGGAGGVLRFPWGRLDRLQGLLYGAAVIYGITFLPVYLIAYCVFLQKVSRGLRLLLSIAIFWAIFLVLWWFVEGGTLQSARFLPFGIVSVIFSDLLADKTTDLLYRRY